MRYKPFSAYFGITNHHKHIDIAHKINTTPMEPCFIRLGYAAFFRRDTPIIPNRPEPKSHTADGIGMALTLA